MSLSRSRLSANIEDASDRVSLFDTVIYFFSGFSVCTKIVAEPDVPDNILKYSPPSRRGEWSNNSTVSVHSALNSE